jgi:hypothetical protein
MRESKLFEQNTFDYIFNNLKVLSKNLLVYVALWWVGLGKYRAFYILSIAAISRKRTERKVKGLKFESNIKKGW